MKQLQGIFAVVAALLFACCGDAFAQSTARAEELKLDYRFEEALGTYRAVLSVTEDSLHRAEIAAEMIDCENGINMMRYVHKPKVVAKKRFHLDEFFLYYPLEDGSWRALPNRLDSLASDHFCAATYIPDDADVLYFSETDTLGVRNLMVMHSLGKTWTPPESVGDALTSEENEIYPMRCSDQIFFASRGLYGMGGYDLYVSTLDPETGQWGVPENMGFPYSSPYDDFLYMNTEDGRYSLFASNRECAPDSVYIYVLENEPVRVREAVADPAELKAISMLTPSSDLKRIDNHSAMGGQGAVDPKVQLYRDRMASVRTLRDSISAANTAIDAVRAEYAAAAPSEKDALAARILQMEYAIPAMNARLAAANRDLQKIEMEFLLSGEVFDMKQVVEESDKEVVGVESSYTFSRKRMGEPKNLLYLKNEVPVIEPELDLAADVF